MPKTPVEPANVVPAGNQMGKEISQINELALALAALDELFRTETVFPFTMIFSD